MSRTDRNSVMRSGCRGVTLIEVIMFTVIVGIAAGGILLVFANTTRASADPPHPQAGPGDRRVAGGGGADDAFHLL
ncbi:MAG: type II secretion system GspH family protein [Rhodocyclaceae bacterium]|nr:type II secretion system GspH family protein [Rhodocyclaceae bacterium]